MMLEVWKYSSSGILCPVLVLHSNYLDFGSFVIKKFEKGLYLDLVQQANCKYEGNKLSGP